MKIKLCLITLILFTILTPGAQARYYDPVNGRFLSPDSILPNAGDPQSLNRYAYVQNNPLIFTDPDGHFAILVPIIVGAVIGAYSAGRATDWNSEYMLRGAFVGAVGGAVGAGVGTYAMGATSNALLSGVIGGAAGGTASGYAGAAMFGGNRGIVMEQGALWGGISGGLAQGMTMNGVPDAFAQAGSGYLSGHWEGGERAANTSAGYAFAGQVLGNALTMTGIGTDGRVPEKNSSALKAIQKTNDTFVVTPAITMKDGGLFWMTIALLTNGTEHTWHAKDRYVPTNEDGSRYYKRVTNNVRYTRETPSRPQYRLWSNNCTTRFGHLSPASYYASHNYVGPSVYGKYDNP